MTPSITTDRSSYSNAAEMIQWSGTGFTPNGQVVGAISIDNVNPHFFAWTFTASADGSASGQFQVGGNVPAGYQKFWVKDISTDTLSNAVQLIIIHSSAWSLVTETMHWKVYSQGDYLTTYEPDILALTPFLDQIFPKIAADFGYSLPTSPKMEIYLDPASHGGATGTPTGGAMGITIAADSVINVVYGIKGFWFYILTLHETVNVWTGYITPGWPWANGSYIWKGGSQFPGMCDGIITRALGYTAVSNANLATSLNDPGVKLLHDLQQTFGWEIYQGMFSLLKTYRVILADLIEPAKTATLIAFMSISAGVDLLPQFISAGVAGISDDMLASVSSSFNLKWPRANRA